MPSARLNDAPVGQTSTHGGVRAVLAHQRQGVDPAGAAVSQGHLVDPAGIGRGAVHRREAVLVVAGAHAGIAVAGALGGVHEHSVTHGAAHRFMGLAGPAGAGERNHGESGHEGRAGHDPRPREEPAPRRAAEVFPLIDHSAPSPNATAGNAAWHPKQSIFTET